MATITSIDPTKSKRTGDVPFTIIGTGFSTSDLSSDFTGPVFYNDISVNGGSILDTTKLALTVDTTASSLAGVETTHTFPRSFDVSILTEFDASTFPSENGVKAIALQAFDDADATTYFEISLKYSTTSGYFISVEAFISGSAVYSKTSAIDPDSIEGLKIIRAEDRMIGYIKITGVFVEIGEYLGFSAFDNRIKFFSSGTTIPLSSPFNVDITNYDVNHVISLVNRPATILTISDTELTGRTLPNEVGTGDVVVGLPDTDFAEIVNGFEYTIFQGIVRDVKNFDLIMSVFNFRIKPSRNELFTSAGGFKWDDNFWINPSKQNKNLKIPSLWDPTTANIPSSFLQSGYGDHDDIELLAIEKFKAEGEELWHAKIQHGTYFVRNVPYFLYSSQSIVLQLGSETTTDGRSKQHLKFLPKPGIPISASTLTTDVESGLIVDKKRFSKRGKFTGKVQNGVELDTEGTLSNIDTTQVEFIVIYNSNNTVNNWKIPVENALAGLYTFTLPSLPIECYPTIFSRKDIFKEQKAPGSFYGDPETIYDQITYGQPLEDPGDYSIDYGTGEVSIILDQEYFDLGFVSYTFDYPAIIEFNSEYLGDKGSTITAPTPSDLPSLDDLGESNGSPVQVFRLSEFPILDFSEGAFLDSDNFNLFLYDESDNTFETDWIRVKSILDYGPTDKVYTLNPDKGTVVFGDGITGAIPIKYKRVLAGYKISVRIEYEPVSSVDYWIGENTDLNLSKNNLNSGFLHLSRKELIPDSISLEWSTNEITSLEFAELKATVRDADGDVVPAALLEFELINGVGTLEEDELVTDSNGEAKTIYLPDNVLTEVAIFVQLFEEGVDPETEGDSIESAYLSSGTLLNHMLVSNEIIDDDPEDIYLFKILDNDDPYLPYDAQQRSGGLFQVLFEFDAGSGQNELIRPASINENILVFEDSLPQPFNISEPNYEPNLRGFAIIANRQVQAKARIDLGLFTIDSDIATLKVSYSPVQKGEWTLPSAPSNFDGSEIDRATYITINP